MRHIFKFRYEIQIVCDNDNIDGLDALILNYERLGAEIKPNHKFDITSKNKQLTIEELNNKVQKFIDRINAKGEYSTVTAYIYHEKDGYYRELLFAILNESKESKSIKESYTQDEFNQLHREFDRSKLTVNPCLDKHYTIRHIEKLTDDIKNDKREIIVDSVFLTIDALCSRFSREKNKEQNDQSLGISLSSLSRLRENYIYHQQQLQDLNAKLNRRHLVVLEKDHTL